MLLPSLLRDHAQLDKQAILLGQGNKFELWSLEAWDASRPDMLNSVQQLDGQGALANLSL
jgi:MraZ protein